MSLPPIDGVATVAAALNAPASTSVPSRPSTGIPVDASGAVSSQSSFGGMVSSGLEQVNQALLGSQQGMQNLALGNVQSLHQVMIRLEESKIAFQLMLQVRNRLLESYQDVMRMQV